MSYHFDINRAVQCAGYLLNKYPEHKHNYTCLLKMLYLADRKSIEETGSPITGDRPVAMDRGPLLSTILDLIKCKGPELNQAIWSRYFTLQGYDIGLELDPGINKLSEYETDVLDRIFVDFGQESLKAMLKYVHELPEYIESYDGHEGTSTQISLKSILKAVSREDDYGELSRQRIEDAYFATLFG